MLGSSSAASSAPSGASSSSSVGRKKKEIWTYEAPWAVYGLAGSMRSGAEFANRFAVGSYIEEYCNKVQARRVNQLWWTDLLWGL